MLFYRNPLDMDDFDDDDTEELAEEKDKDVKIPNKYNLQAGPVQFYTSCSTFPKWDRQYCGLLLYKLET